jgi:hypothetical protein
MAPPLQVSHYIEAVDPAVCQSTAFGSSAVRQFGRVEVVIR